MKKTASQFALLAEREIAENDFDTALGYVRVGLQIDPDNEALRVLGELAQKPNIGFWGALSSIFKSDS